jgi:hypothetical protein
LIPFPDGGTFKLTSVYTDGSSAFLRIGCSSDKKGIWAIISNTLDLSPETTREMLAKVEEYGFDSTDHITLDYSDCMRTFRDDVQEGTCDAGLDDVDNWKRPQVSHERQCQCQYALRPRTRY